MLSVSLVVLKERPIYYLSKCILFLYQTLSKYARDLAMCLFSSSDSKKKKKKIVKYFYLRFSGD